VRECAASPADRVHLDQQPLLYRLLQRQKRVVQAGQRGGIGKAALGAEDGSGDDEALGVRGTAGKPGEHQRLQGPRRGQGRTGVAQHIGGQVVQEFLDVQRDSAGVLPEPFRCATRQPAGAEPVRQQADALGGQAVEGNP
jgi:hypothetical protein